MTRGDWRFWLAWIWWGDPAEATLGRRGERAAARFLRRQKFRLVRRNLRLRCGEIDLLMRAPDGRTLVIVEVKTRITDPARPAPPPEASVHAHKRRKLAQLAGALAVSARFAGQPIRIDVVAVDWPREGRPLFRHFAGAVHTR